MIDTKGVSDIVFNVQFQICGLIMVCMVMFFYFSKKTLPLLTEEVFRTLLITVMICILLDIASIFSINFKHILPQAIVDFICKSYTISLCCVTFVIRIYVLVNITHKQLSKKQKILHSIPLGIDIICCIILPIYLYVGKGEIYTYGPVIYVAYITAAIYLISSIYYIIRCHNRIKKPNFNAICFLLVVWIVTASIQMVKSEWLLVGFAMGSAMVYMYFCLENPAQKVDALTGLFNQTSYHQYLENLFFRNKKFTLLVFAIEDMKFINETFGVQNVDTFLQEVAQYLSKNFSGKAFREHDNRFALVLDKEDVEEVKSVIQKRFAEIWKISNTEYKTCICMIEMDPSECGLTLETVMELSKYFMSKAKKQGKGSYLHVTKEQVQEKEKKYQIEQLLRKAIERKEIQVYYQPIYSVKDGKYTSAEALARLTDEEGNFISPDAFIRVAEQNGMILKLGMLIFEKICKFISENSLEEQGMKYIEINLSVVQCMQAQLAEQLIHVMEEYSISPEFINLEITETAVANSEIALKRNMNTLLRKGVSFSLDDYGTGYSNLSYLLELPIKIIKIDKSMVHACCTTEKVKIAMECTILMIKKMGLQIVVEGIETKEQLETMNQLDVDFIQGYYFSKPLPANDLLTFLP